MSETTSFSVFADDLVRAKEEAKAAHVQLDSVLKQKEEHASVARSAKAEAQAAREEAEAERLAHTDTKAKLAGLQERAGLTAELERQLGEATSVVSELSAALKEKTETLKALGIDLNTVTTELVQSAQAREKAETRLASYEKLAEALAAKKLAKETIAAELERLV